MPSSTTIPGVLSALVARWAVIMPAGTDVNYGPTPQGNADAVVEVGRVLPILGEVEPAALGPNRPRYENYEVEVTFTVSVRGKAVQRAATEAALNLYDIAQLDQRTLGAENLGIANVAWARWTGSVEVVPSLFDAGNNCAVKAWLQVKAHI